MRRSSPAGCGGRRPIPKGSPGSGEVDDYDLRTVLSRLKRPEICAPETYRELIRTPRMQERLLALGLVKKPVSERERRRDELTRLPY